MSQKNFLRLPICFHGRRVVSCRVLLASDQGLALIRSRQEQLYTCVRTQGRYLGRSKAENGSGSRISWKLMKQAGLHAYAVHGTPTGEWEGSQGGQVKGAEAPPLGSVRENLDSLELAPLSGPKTWDRH